ncbi:MAG: gamma-glutamylcyclotransferase [Bacteroidetes bacterium]|nr:gamma-glutamylcyclotransferase [Bacteroidota bacterium]
MLIFCYGSNMCRERFEQRIPSSRYITSACLDSHQLKFHKKSIDGSAKADAYYTGRVEDKVWGVVNKIDPKQKVLLDEYEGLGVGYDHKEVEVGDVEGKKYKTWVYFAIKIGKNLKPYKWYKEFVLAGALQHGLPPSYIKKIATMPHHLDKNRQRANFNQRIIGVERARLSGFF